MKTSLDCLHCYLKQSLRVARLQGCSEDIQHEVVKRVAVLLPELDLNDTPPANAIAVYRVIHAVTGVRDPYYEVKRKENSLALERLPGLREEVRRSDTPLRTAVGYAIAGNIIDYGAASRFDLGEAIERGGAAEFVIDYRDELISKISRLASGARILYLTDNCGEVVYDSLVIELLAEKNFDITVAVKDGPIINDALAEDAVEAGLAQYAAIITNGVVCPGTPLASCSEDFLDRFAKADLIISKGQGNFETLSEEKREIFFLLTVKCEVVAKHLARLSGTDPSLLSGKGEMVVYRSGS